MGFFFLPQKLLNLDSILPELKDLISSIVFVMLGST